MKIHCRIEYESEVLETRASRMTADGFERTFITL
jgi:hypothetical protein